MMTSGIICYVIGVAYVLQLDTSSAVDVRLPPTIIRSPNMQYIYRDDTTIVLPCVAVASSPIEYIWHRNEVELDFNYYRIHGANDGTGTITIPEATRVHQGYYKCFAKTMDYGTAVSNTSHLQSAYLYKDSGRMDVRNITVNAGNPFKIDPINLPRSFPPPSYSWAIERIVDSNPRSVVLDRRVQISDEGQLFFAYAKVEDSSRDQVYKCIVNNPYLDVKQGSSYTRVNIIDGHIEQFKPTKQFITSSPIVAVEGRNVSVRCIFSGNPEPQVSMTRKDASLPIGRYEFQNFNTKLLIKNVQQYDEGDYECRGSNPQGTELESFQIDVQAAPTFRHFGDGPRNINATHGDTIIVNCSAYAEPEANIEWFRNGDPLELSDLSAKFHLSSDRRRLTISGLCKICADGSSDLQVLQCNASNVHGYAFNSGYINVLDRTTLEDDEPIEASVNRDDVAVLEFPCFATSDDSTSVSVRWYRIDNDNGNEIPAYDVGGQLKVDKNGTMIIQRLENATTDWIQFHGDYRCRASNGYSEAVRNVFIKVKDYVPPAQQKQTAGVADMWWVFIIIAVVLLFVVILFCVYGFVYRGESYKVDKKERRTGNNPLLELLDSGFHDYQRPAEEKGSRTTLDDVAEKAGSDDGGSLSGYVGDVDYGKFNEDGSFVGVYTQGRSASQSHA